MNDADSQSQLGRAKHKIHSVEQGTIVPFDPNNAHLSSFSERGQIPTKMFPITFDFERNSQGCVTQNSLQLFANTVCGVRDTLQKPDEIEALADFILNRYAGNPINTVVEIGTYHGGTLWMFSQFAANGANLISIDLPDGNFSAGSDNNEFYFMKNYIGRFEQVPEGLKHLQNFHYIREDSHDQMTKETLSGLIKRLNTDVDILFIDGDHSYEGVKKDYYMYKEFVADGGLIIFHDINEHKQVPFCRPHQFWHEIKGKDSSEYLEIIGQGLEAGWGPDWAGIGIIVVSK